jgi:hypothetical protein
LKKIVLGLWFCVLLLCSLACNIGSPIHGTPTPVETDACCLNIPESIPTPAGMQPAYVKIGQENFSIEVVTLEGVKLWAK